MTLAVDARGIAKDYPTHLGLRRARVLVDLDLQVEAGGVLGLVGPNGSGKSTLLRMLAGVDFPSAGELHVLGGSPADAKVRARVGYLPEGSPYPLELSARACLALFASLAGLPRDASRERAEELLTLVGLADAATRPLRRYSRGMLRRFGLAQAWLHDPELILLDEPTAGLDAIGFGALDELLERARTRHATVVLCTHFLGDLHARCDSLAVLLGGRVAARGTPQEVLGNPGHWTLEVEELSEAALDQVAARVSELGGRLVRREASGRALVEVYRSGSAQSRS
ncbi:MAG: ABC transporter ATP-binding protein [Planctomycetes bacterium]|nr:ABC transporter ATP-binding protein [Planctomycetota bacterium]